MLNSVTKYLVEGERNNKHMVKEIRVKLTRISLTHYQ